MTTALLLLLLFVGLGAIFGVGGMIYSFQMRKHGLVQGATQTQLAAIHETLAGMHDRLARLEEHAADQVLAERDVRQIASEGRTSPTP